MRIIIGLMILWGFMISSACQAIPGEDETLLEATPSVTDIPPTLGDIQMTPSPTNPGRQGLIDKAKEDLAERLAASDEDILLLEATSVVWPDASLGCPQEGMVYAQVLTPGYLIRLKSGSQEFEYHTSKGTSIVYCENPTPPVQGTPGDV